MTTYQVEASRAATASESAYSPIRTSQVQTSSNSNARSERKVVVGLLIGGVIVLALLLSLVVGSFTTYGLRDGLIVSIMFALILGLTGQLGRIPVAGPLIYVLVARRFILPMLFGWFPTIHASWVTEGQFWVNMASATVLTIVSIISIWSKPKK
jgi:hypothetical protein